MRVVFAAEKPLEGELSLIAPDGSVAAKSRERHGGPPYFWFAEVKSPAAGTWRATLARDRAPAECSTITRDIAVRADAPPRPSTTAGSVWPLRNTWNRATENLFSAWIEKLFDDPLDAAPSWPALHEVLRDRSRNFLFNHLGLGEDEMKMVLRPDCADLPYFLRAYFAFKMGLPFGYSKCTRGGGGRAPRCPQWFNIQNAEAARPPPPPPKPEAAPSAPPPPRGFAASLGLAAPSAPPAPPSAPPRAEPTCAEAARACGGVRRVFRGSSPTASIPDPGERPLNDNNTDYYPVSLRQETLRPGPCTPIRTGTS